MTDLVSRLLEAITETERKAQRIAEQDEWDESPHDRLRLVINDRYPASLYDDDEPPRGPLLEVLSLADPSSFLRRCAADRKLIELHSRMTIMPGHPYFNDAHLTQEPMSLCRSCEPETQWRRERSWPCRTILTLAESYGLSDHQEGEE